MNEENEEFEREMNYKSPSQVMGDSVAREFADGQEEDKDGWVTIENKYITVLDFEIGEVYQYESAMCDFEEFITNKGHNLNNCQWMIHDNSEIIKS